MEQLKVKWTGIRPLVMHNGSLADRENPYTVQIKGITSKRAKDLTDAEHATRNRLEWEGGLYWDDEAGPHIPSDNIERCIQLGAQKSKLGKQCQAAVLVEDEVIPVDYAGPRNKDKLYADARFSLRKGVVVQKARVIRIRPMMPTGWSVQFTLNFDPTVINQGAIIKAMKEAGALVGLGDWRPKFGRFLVEVI